MTRPGLEFQVVATGAPGAKVWGQTAAEAAAQYARAFKPAVGSNVILRPVEDHSRAELYAVTRHGLTRLAAGKP